jgi:hypothetical protein
MISDENDQRQTEIRTGFPELKQPCLDQIIDRLHEEAKQLKAELAQAKASLDGEYANWQTAIGERDVAISELAQARAHNAALLEACKLAVSWFKGTRETGGLSAEEYLSRLETAIVPCGEGLK